MKHLGDITKINGAEIPPVEIICGGSPCQDLSVAGKREGLAGERSGLFMEQIRIVKEMRENDRRNGRTNDTCRPRFLVWENVPGAFSSNKGEDFRIVLEEIAKVAERDACIPRLEKWPHAGCIMGDGWSLAWRLHDAQFWGVPQRRKRIALVADFAGGAAPEILFEREGVSGNIAQGGKEGERTSGNAERCTDPSSYTLKIRGGVERDSSGKKAGKGPLVQTELSGTLGVSQDQTLITNVIGFNRERCGAVTMDDAMPTLQAAAGESGNNQPMVCLNDQGGQQMSVTENVSGTLRAQEHGHQPIVYGISSDGSNAMRSDNPHSGIYEAETSRTLDLNGGSPACNQGGMVVVSMQSKQQSMMLSETTSGTLGANDYKEPQVVCVEGNGSRPSHRGDGYAESETMYTLNSTEHHAVAVENHPNDSRVKVSDDGMVQTLSSRMGTGGGNVPMLIEEEQEWNWIVRRLTPLECERLQGFPDGWTDIGDWIDTKGKKHKGESDAPRYKALGNSIALPFWEWMADRMVKVLKEEGCENPTMGSLFDGIGGFPLVYQRCGCEPIWASEIEEFPIAVTKLRFPDKEDDE